MTTTDVQIQGKNSPATARPRVVLSPDTDIWEQDDAYVVVADVPGVAEKDVEVTVEDDVLTLRAHGTERAPAAHDSLYQEFMPADYERSFELAESVDADRIRATLRNGTLRVVLPKAEARKPRQIRVETS